MLTPLKSRIVYSLAIVSAMLAVSPSARAYYTEKKSRCFSAEETAPITDRIRIRVGTGSAPWNRCDPTARFYQLMEAMLFMRDLDFSGYEVNYPYNQEIIGYDWYNMILSRTRTIGFGTPDGCRHAIAYSYNHNTQMYMCSGYYSSEKDNPQGTENIYFEGDPGVVERVATLMHEYRHMTTDKVHVACNGQEQGCDSSVDYQGAFAAEVEALAKMGRTATNIHPAQASYASRMAWVVASERFRKKPSLPELQDKRLVVIQRDDGKIFSVSHIEPFQEDFQRLPKAGKIIPIGSIALFRSYIYLPDDPNKPAVVYDSYGLTASNADLFNSDYEYSKDVSQLNIPAFVLDRNRNLADVILANDIIWDIWHYIENGKLKAYLTLKQDLREQADMSKYPDANFELALPQGEIPVKLREGLIQGADNSGYTFVYMESGHIYKLKHESVFKRGYTSGDFSLEPVDNPLPGYQEAFRTNPESDGSPGYLYAISDSGEFFYRKDSDGDFRPVPGAEGMKFKRFLQEKFIARWIPKELEPYAK